MGAPFGNKNASGPHKTYAGRSVIRRRTLKFRTKMHRYGTNKSVLRPLHPRKKPYVGRTDAIDLRSRVQKEHLPPKPSQSGKYRLSAGPRKHLYIGRSGMPSAKIHRILMKKRR